MAEVRGGQPKTETLAKLNDETATQASQQRGQRGALIDQPSTPLHADCLPRRGWPSEPVAENTGIAILAPITHRRTDVTAIMM
jgi:hypothetical protein